MFLVLLLVTSCCSLFSRTYDVCHPLQHGAYWVTFVQDWDRADRFTLRSGQHEDHDTDRNRCFESPGQWGVCKMPSLSWMPAAAKR